MMKKSMATKTSLSFSPPNHPLQFTPIEEGNEDDDEEYSEERMSVRETPPPPASDKRDGDRHGPRENKISCNKCRPSNRDKFSVSIASPNGLFKSVLSSLAPKREDHWKIVAAELSNKLVHATTIRDQAILESSNLKYTMADLEKKLNKLEIYCHTFKSATATTTTTTSYKLIKVGDRRRVIEHFLVSVSEARSTVRILGRALSLHAGGKVLDRISMLSRPYHVSISFPRAPRGFLEALLSRALFEDFESAEYTPILNPVDRCESNFAMFSRLKGLTWHDVLNKGTRHFSGEFSKFCDRKMSQIVGLLGWNRAWPEPLLQAFFRASKAVWLVHLLANSVHPGLPIFRVDNGAGFDPVYMEDIGGDKARSRRLVPGIVRMMVTPGFYVYDNVVKCKVLCRYYNNANGGNEFYYDKGLVPSPS